MTLYLILFLILFPLAVGLFYGAIERLTARWLKKRGWRVKDSEDECFAWEPQYIYNLPPGEEWRTIWEACRAQLKPKKKSNTF